MLIGLIFRIIALPRTVGDVDSVNFARGLSAFDPLHQAPHFPGYPVYMAAAKVMGEFAPSEAWALCLPALLTFPFASLLLTSALFRSGFEKSAWVPAAVFALTPGIISMQAWPSSDGFALSVLIALIGAFLRGHEDRRWRLATQFGCAMLLGVRPSWFPIAGGLALLAFLQESKENRRLHVAVAIAGVASWVVPLSMALGSAGFFELAPTFIGGHFYEWGNSGFSSDAVWQSRVASAATALALGLFGTRSPFIASLSALVFLVVATLLLVRGRQTSKVNARGFAFAAVAYACWVLIGQNTDHVRHFLPLFVLLTVGGIAIVKERHRIQNAVVALFVTSTLLSLPELLIQGRHASGALETATVLVKNHAPNRLQVLLGEEARVLQHVAPHFRVLRPADSSATHDAIRFARAQGADVIFSSKVPGATHLRSRSDEIASIDLPQLRDVVRDRLTLFRLRSDAFAELHIGSFP